MSPNQQGAKRNHSYNTRSKLRTSKKSCVSIKKLNDHVHDNVGRATVPITPQMIRQAVKELQTRRVYISSSLIGNHMRRSYPIENNPELLEAELSEKLNCAVSVGLIAKCGDDKYCMPTLRQQATANKTAFSAFWGRYHGNSGDLSGETEVNMKSSGARSHRSNSRQRSSSRRSRSELLR